jgi:hypothetical protein
LLSAIALGLCLAEEEAMTDGVNNPSSGDAIVPHSNAEPDDRWPLPYSVVVVVGSSGVLWALIIAAVRWLTV